MFALRKPAVEVTAGETTRVGMHILRSMSIIGKPSIILISVYNLKIGAEKQQFYYWWRCRVIVLSIPFQKLFLQTSFGSTPLFSTAQHVLLWTFINFPAKITWVLFCNWAAKKWLPCSEIMSRFFLLCCASWVDSPCCLRPSTTTGCGVQLAPGLDMCPNCAQMRMRQT